MRRLALKCEDFKRLAAPAARRRPRAAAPARVSPRAGCPVRGCLDPIGRRGLPLWRNIYLLTYQQCPMMLQPYSAVLMDRL